MGKTNDEEGYDRYDRQMMLWGKYGQKVLKDSRVCLISHGQELISMEILKSLVLLGVGDITLVGEEIKHCFFDWENITNMNCDVHVHRISGEEMLEWDRRTYSGYSLVVSVCNKGKLFDRIWELWKMPRGLPRLVICHANDRIGYISLIGKGNHYFVDSDANGSPDLCLDMMWEELEEFHSSFRLLEMTTEELCKVPYTVLLVHALERLRRSRNEVSRKTVSDTVKQLYKELIGDDNVLNFLNFKEAIKNSFLLSNKSTSIALENLHLLEKKSSVYESEVDRYFVDVISALRKFVNTYGRLPISGDVPDMECSTKLFNKQKAIYEKKAQEDHSILINLLQDRNVPEIFVKMLVKDVRKLKMIELAQISSLLKTHGNERFEIILKSHLSETFSTLANPCLSAVIGGLASQECVKLLTHQYAPVENTLLYDVSSSDTVIFKL